MEYPNPAAQFILTVLEAGEIAHHPVNLGCELGADLPVEQSGDGSHEEPARLAIQGSWGEVTGEEINSVQADNVDIATTEYFAGAEAIDGHPTPLHILARNQI